MMMHLKLKKKVCLWIIDSSALIVIDAKNRRRPSVLYEPWLQHFHKNHCDISIQTASIATSIVVVGAHCWAQPLFSLASLPRKNQYFNDQVAEYDHVCNWLGWP